MSRGSLAPMAASVHWKLRVLEGRAQAGRPTLLGLKR